MKLTIKEINRSQAIYKLLVEIDADIIKLDKRAMMLSEHSQKVDLTLTFEGKSNVLDEDGSLIGIERDYMSMMSRYLLSPTPNKPKEDTLDLSLSDVEALAMFGFLINLKKQQRQALIDELIKIGFEIY